MSSIDTGAILGRLNERRSEAKRIIGNVIDGVYDHASVELVFAARGQTPTKEQLDAALRDFGSDRIGNLGAQSNDSLLQACDSLMSALNLPLNSFQLPQPNALSSEVGQSSMASPISVEKPQQPRKQFAQAQRAHSSAIPPQNNTFQNKPFSARQVNQFRPPPQPGCLNRHPSPLSPYALLAQRMSPIAQLFAPQQQQQVASVHNTPGGPVNIVPNQNEPAHSVASASLVGSVEQPSAQACNPTNQSDYSRPMSGAFSLTPGLAHKNVTASGPASTFASVVCRKKLSSSSTSTTEASLKTLSASSEGSGSVGPFSQTVEGNSVVPQGSSQQEANQIEKHSAEQEQVTSVLNTPAGPVNVSNQKEPAQSVAFTSLVGSIEPSSARACNPTKSPLPGCSTKVPSHQPSGPTRVASPAGSPRPLPVNQSGYSRPVPGAFSPTPGLVGAKNVTASGATPAFGSLVRSNTLSSSSALTTGASQKTLVASSGSKSNSNVQPITVCLKDGRKVPLSISMVAQGSSSQKAKEANQLKKHSIEVERQLVNQHDHHGEPIQSQTTQNLVASKKSGPIPLFVNKNRLNDGQKLTQNKPNPPIVAQSYGVHSPMPGTSKAIAPKQQLLTIDTMQRPGLNSPEPRKYSLSSPLSPRRSDRIQKRAASPMPSTSRHESPTPAKQVRFQLNTDQLPSQPSNLLRASKAKYDQAEAIVNQMITKQVECLMDNCKKVFEGKTQLEQHLKQVHNSGMFICGAPGCGQAFEKAPNFVGHIYREHRGVKSWPCTKCDSDPFESVRYLNLHTKLEHQPGDFGCYFARCDFSSKLRKNVLDHVLKVHRKVAK